MAVRSFAKMCLYYLEVHFFIKFFSFLRRHKCCLKHIDDWMKINKLSINFTKIKFMVITRKIIYNQFHLHVASHSIERIHQITYRYLRLLLDDELLWNSHIQKQCSKVAKGCWALLKIKKYVDLSTLKTVYYELVHPHLQFCILAWGLASNRPTVHEPLIKMQKRAIRYMTKSPHIAPSKPLFHKLGAH